MITEIKRDLADNFREGDEAILQNIIDEVTNSALSISNRKRSQKNINTLSMEIKKCVKGIYLNRGSEGTKSIGDDGKSLSFEELMTEMRENIVKSGKRVPFI